MDRTALALALCCVLAPVAVVASGSPSSTGRSAGPAQPSTGTGAGALPAGQYHLEQRSNALGAPPASPPENTTAYLTIPPGNVSNATVSGVDLDVAGTLAAEGAATEGQLLTLTIEERLSRANTTAERRAVIRQAAARIERRIDRLRAEQRRAIERYSDGERTTSEFLRTLVRVERRAQELRGSIARLEEAATTMPGTALGERSVDAWARDRLVELGAFASPVRRAIYEALEGSDPLAVYAEVSETGVVLAAVDNGWYVREAYLPAERDAGPADGPDSISAALERVRGLYPWAWNHSTGVRSAGGPGAGSYRFTIFHGQGRVSTYLDSETGTVFREVQVKSLRTVPTAPAVTRVEDGLRVAVGRTYATGPMNVSVAASGTDEPVDATVAVENRTVGRTGSGGYLWAISPRGTVNVTVSDGERTATVRLAADPRLAAEEGRTTPATESKTPLPSGSRTLPTDGSTPEANGSTRAGNRSPDPGPAIDTENGSGPTATEPTPGTGAAASLSTPEPRSGI